MKYYGSYSEINMSQKYAVKEADEYINYSGGYTDMDASYIREISLLYILRDRSNYIIEIRDSDPEKLQFSMDKYEFSLLYYLELNKNLDYITIKRIIYQIVLGLKHLENNNILHRDIKPDNILIDSDLNVRIIDFGISCYNWKHMEDFDRTQTLYYRSPEAFLYLENKSEDFSKMDIWSLGLILVDIIRGYNNRMSFFDDNGGQLGSILYYLFISYDIINDNTKQVILDNFNRIREKYNVPIFILLSKYQLGDLIDVSFKGKHFTNEDAIEIYHKLYNLLVNNIYGMFYNNKIQQKCIQQKEGFTPQYSFGQQQGGFIQQQSFGQQQLFVQQQGGFTQPSQCLEETYFNPILREILMFDPKNRISLTDLMNHELFYDIRDNYIYTEYEKYNSKPTKRLDILLLMQTERDVIFNNLLNIFENHDNFQYIHFINAIHIIDMYSCLNIEFIKKNKYPVIRKHNLKPFYIACLLISLKLYRYMEEYDFDYIDDRREDYLIEIFDESVTHDIMGKITNLEIDIVSALKYNLYIPKSLFTDTENLNIRCNYIHILRDANYVNYSYKELIDLVNIDSLITDDERIIRLVSKITNK